MIKIVIVEDEAIAARRLERMLSVMNNVELLVTLSSEKEFLTYWEVNGSHVDLIISDIDLGDSNSIDVYQSQEIEVPIIFCTAFKQYSLEAFKVTVVDYLLKPIRVDELENAIEKFKKIFYINSSYTKTLTFVSKVGNEFKVINVQDIQYIFSKYKLSHARLSNGSTYVLDETLETLEEELSKHQFFRVNRQMIVRRISIHKISRYTRSRLKIEVDPPFSESIVISTNRSREFKRWIQ